MGYYKKLLEKSHRKREKTKTTQTWYVTDTKPTCNDCHKYLKKNEGRGQTIPLCNLCQEKLDFLNNLYDELERELDEQYYDELCRQHKNSELI